MAQDVNVVLMLLIWSDLCPHEELRSQVSVPQQTCLPGGGGGGAGEAPPPMEPRSGLQSAALILPRAHLPSPV